MKTIKEHFESIANPTIRQRALLNMNVKHSKRKEGTLHMAIFNGFRWSDTPEGGSYWADVHSMASNGKIKTLLKTDSQKQQILNDLSTGVRVTGLKAIVWYGCIKLSNRISELREDGYEIKGEWKEIKTKHGVKRVMEYFMPQPKL